MSTAYDVHPEPGRALVGAAEAAAVLRRDVRTVRTMITTGALEGVRLTSGTRHRWYVYADQVSAQTPRRRRAQLSTAAQERLIEENAELRARVANAEETTRSLLGVQAILMDALRAYRTGSEQVVAAQSKYDEIFALQRDALSSFQSSSNQFAEALSATRDILAAQATPDDPRSITDHQV